MSIGIALLISRDAKAIQTIGEALRQLSLVPDICQLGSSALRLLNRRKFDTIIVDLDLGSDASAILNELRRSSSNRKAVTFAIMDEKGAATAAPQCDFVFARPLSMASICSELKGAYALILRERRRYFRCPVSLPVLVHRLGLAEVHCHALNISEGGMALSTFVPFEQGEKIRAEFTLPGQAAPSVVPSEICWWRTGHLGLRFTQATDEFRSDLQGWLSAKLDELLPEYVRKQFEGLVTD
jgi:hypothetical protein